MTDMTWRPKSETDPVERHASKLYQAEMLARCLKGEAGEGFRTLNGVVQDGVCWLLADLITEAREAHEEATRLRKQRNEQASVGGKL